MQRFWRFLLGLLVFALGVIGVLAGALPEEAALELQLIAEALQAGWVQAGAIAGGILLMLIPLAVVARWYAARRYGRDLTYRNDHGAVSVSLQAVEEALNRLIERQPSVRRVTVRCRDDRVRRALVIEVALTLWDDEDVTGQNRRYQDLLRQRLAELMPDQDSVQIMLHVAKLSPRSADDTVAEDSHEPEPAQATVTDDTQPASARIALPGLAATQGGVDNRAGAELLRRRRETRDGDTDAGDAGAAGDGNHGEAVGADEPAGIPDHGPIAPSTTEVVVAGVVPTSVEATGVAAVDDESDDTPLDDHDDDDDDDPYADLYQGPTYPVPDDDDGSGVYPSAKT